MTFKDKEKEIEKKVGEYGARYVWENQINSFFVSFPHLDDYIKFSFKNPWGNSEEIEEAEYIEGGDFYEELFECEDCKEYIENFQNIEEIADWVEKEE